MTLPFTPPLEPMLAELQDDIPVGDGWLYEPKWDGFRAIMFRDEDGSLQIASRKGQPLERYFPELTPAINEALPRPGIIDGEIIIAGPKGLDFDALLMRIHPAASRIARLAKETPAMFVAFDVLADGGEDLRELPFVERRRRLEQCVTLTPDVFLTPQTADPASARRWFERYEGAGLDGVVAKRAELPYRAGERIMVKVKHLRTVDCVVGGYRMSKDGKSLGSLLLGLYRGGVLQHVGHTSSFSAGKKKEVLAMLEPLKGGTSFGEGRTPGGPSRWSQGRDMSWTSVTPQLVCEVAFDHLQGDRLRHAARFLRWRPDKAPGSCTYEQLDPPHPFSLEQIRREALEKSRST